MRGRASFGSRCAWLIGVAVMATLLDPAPGRAGKETWMVGLDAAGFSGVDLLKNRPVTLSDHLKERVILLEFGSIYSSASMAKLPTLLRLRRDYPEEQLTIINVFLDITNPQRVLKLFRSLGVEIGFQVVIDRDLKISQAYQVENLPTSVVIDRDGMVVMAFAGHSASAEREMELMLAALIRGEYREERKTAVPVDTPGNQLAVHTPESFTKTSGRALHVVGSVSGADRQQIFYKLNNQLEKQTVADKGVFHFRTDLALALNIIEIRAEATPGEPVSESLVIFREAAYGREFKSELPQFLFHQNEEQKSCQDCHRTELTPAERGGSSLTQICGSCHRDQLRQAHAHGPVSAGFCLPCHDDQSAPSRYQTRRKGQDLCQGCHAESVKGFQKKVVHGPAAAGACSVCHDPHGAPERFRLRKGLELLCGSCHPERAADASRAMRHDPFAKELCNGCHAAHASDNERRLLLPISQLCTSCHAEVPCPHRSHVGEQPRVPPTTVEARAACDPAGLIRCTSCHASHASGRSSLVRGTRTEGTCVVLCHGLELEGGAAAESPPSP